jgi:hypothetical protein
MIITGTVCWPPFKSVLSGLWIFAITILKMRYAELGVYGGVRTSLHGVPLTA